MVESTNPKEEEPCGWIFFGEKDDDDYYRERRLRAAPKFLRRALHVRPFRPTAGV